MKKIILMICCLLLIITPLSASALTPKIVDNAELLTADERATLEQRANALAGQYGFDVVILTTDSLNGVDSQSYADNFYDQNGYGVGPNYSGILLLLSMEYRDWAISTCGEAIYAFSDYGIQNIFFEIAGYLSENQYYFAFTTYLDSLEVYMEAFQNGAPIDGYVDDYHGPGSYEPGTQEDIIYYPTYDYAWSNEYRKSSAWS